MCLYHWYYSSLIAQRYSIQLCIAIRDDDIDPLFSAEEKGLAFLAQLERLKEKLMIAGKIYLPKLGRLAEMQCSNIIVHDKFLTDDEIECYTAAADMGFLSYRSILTSGALFHLLSGGLPVIAPRLGTIPAYMAQVLSEGEEDVEDVLLHCCRLPREDIEVMGEHALVLATSLEWRYY